MGLLGSFFNFVDPILDKIDPMHNKVQTWTTGSSETEGQRPYFETIAPMIVDAFLPGVGSAVGAADKASTGNWTGAGISALGAMYGLGSLGSTGSSAAGGAEAATAASSADDVASAGSAASNASGYTSGYDSFASAPSASSTPIDSYGANSMGKVNVVSAAPPYQNVNTNPYGAPVDTAYLDSGSLFKVSNQPEMSDQFLKGFTTNDPSFVSNGQEITGLNVAAGKPGYGWKYYDDGTAISPDGHYYHGGEMVTGAGGQSKGILDYATEYGGKADRFINGKDAQQAMKIGAAGMATDQKLRAQQAMKNQQMMPRPVDAPDWGANSGRQVRSFQEISPYQNFNGGFNPRRMSRSGLLG